MVARNLTVSHRFVCLTENPEGLTCETHPLPGFDGWWNKLAFFHKSAADLAERLLVIDLDVVITGSLDPLAEATGDIALTWDWSRGWCMNGACYLLRAGAFPEVYDRFVKERPGKFWGDQEWMTHVIPQAAVQEWPGLWIRSYRFHCNGHVPEDCKVVCFHGRPKPHECQHVEWVRDLWK